MYRPLHFECSTRQCKMRQQVSDGCMGLQEPSIDLELLLHSSVTNTEQLIFHTNLLLLLIFIRDHPQDICDPEESL